MIEFFNTILALGSIVLLLVSVVLIVLLILNKHDSLFSWISKNGLLIGFFTTLAAVLGSLVYSNGIGYEPCILCWYQRIAIFPLPIVFLSGYIKNNRDFAFTTLIISSIGFVISLYHNFIDFGGNEFISCGSGPSCLQRFVAEFGFVTIPFMSASILLFSMVISVIILRKQRLMIK